MSEFGGGGTHPPDTLPAFVSAQSRTVRSADLLPRSPSQQCCLFSHFNADNLYVHRRWPALQAALLKPTQHAAVVNAFVGTPADSGDAASAAASASSSSITTASNAAGLVPLLSLGGVLSTLCRGPGTKPSSPYPPPPLDPGSALRCWYWMDLASVMPVLLLAPRRGHAALDMCAAPGGKACLIAQRLFGPGALVPAPPAPAPAVPVEAANAEQPGSIGRESGTGGKTPGGVSVSGSAAEAAPHQLPLPRLPLGPGKLVCNEPDRQRLARLQRVIEEYVPPHSRANIEVRSQWGHNNDSAWDWEQGWLAWMCIAQLRGAVQGMVSTSGSAFGILC